MLKLCFLFAIAAIYIISSGDAHTSNFIAGGVDVKDNEVPYQVSLQYNETLFCSGIILKHRWIVTTAGCSNLVTNISAFSVLAGTTKLNIGGVRIGVEKIVIHEDYDAKTTNNDIALIKLKHCLKLNINIQLAILLPTNIGDGTIGTIFGWGDLSSNSSDTTNNLKKLNVTTITNEVCQKSIRSKLPDSVICTNDGNGKGLCGGDGGDPLVMVSTNLVIGIAAAAFFPCAGGRPDLYTRISKFIPWLELHSKH